MVLFYILLALFLICGGIELSDHLWFSHEAKRNRRAKHWAKRNAYHRAKRKALTRRRIV